MTDDRRLEIERRFDGELDSSGPSLPLGNRDDPEARRHIDRLVLLRDLARRHDPAAEVPRRKFDLPDRRPGRARWWLAVAAAAAAIAVYFWPFARAERPDAPVIVQVEPTVKPIVRSVETTNGRPPLEVELYGWANTPSRAPKQAARLVLGPASTSKKRSPADEILALELANTSPLSRSGVQRFAVSRGSKPAPQTKPTNRAKAPFPEV